MRSILELLRSAAAVALLTLLPAGQASAADPPATPPAPVKLIIKPVLCVIEGEGASCAVTFDIRWKSPRPGEFCLNDSVQPAPLRCWPLARAGEMQQERVFSEDFRFWLTRPTSGVAPPAGTERLSEVKIEVLRVGSSDRRRERRTRHVWDVL
jgi:hypothetical protein